MTGFGGALKNLAWAADRGGKLEMHSASADYSGKILRGCGQCVANCAQGPLPE